MFSSKLVAKEEMGSKNKGNLASSAYSSADRASVFGTEGRGFESLWARQLKALPFVEISSFKATET